MSRFRVDGFRSQWGVFEGARALRWFRTHWEAETYAEDLARKARARARPCLTCRATFMSEGPHHRMCGACRQHSHYDGAA